MSGVTCYTHDPTSALDLSCNVRKEGSPTNPTLITPPDVGPLKRKVFTSNNIKMPDGVDVNHWGFEDDLGAKKLPSPPIIANVGQLVHVRLEASTSTHTIHFHGIEPEDCNDGVGHTSWEVSGAYTYQWRPTSAGTFIYHCHVNTTLHFHMGLWGPLIIYPTTGPNTTAFDGGPAYNVERVWAWHGIDTRFRQLNHAAGLCDVNDNPQLNVYNPSYFLLSGAAQPTSETDPEVAVTIPRGQTLLARLICADYFPLHVDFGGLTGTVISSDGHHFDTFFQKQSIDMTSAERYDVLFTPTNPGTYTIRGSTRHWKTGVEVGYAQTKITVT